MDRMLMEKKYKKENPEPSMSDDEKLFIAVVFGGIIIFTLIILLGILFGGSEEKGCEDIGGEFVVVGEEYSPALKHTIDVYGCIK